MVGIFVEGREKGVLLLFALGILSLLAVMGIIFATFIRTETIASHNWLDAVRAEQVAQSGIIRAIAELKPICAQRPYDAISDRWVYKDKGGNLANGKPLEDENVVPTCSGDLGGTYTRGGNTYRVKVIDCASQINLNGGQPIPVLARMFDALGEAIAIKTGTNPVAHLQYRDMSGNLRKGGEAIVYFRERLVNAKFVSKNQLLELYQMSEPVSPDADKKAFDKFKLIEDFITTHAWVDTKCVVGNETDKVEGFSTFAYEPHSPVNINLAPREVLFAVLKGLAGRFRYVYIKRKQENIEEKAPPDLRPPVAAGKEEVEYDEIPVYAFVPPLTADQANAVAAAIETRRRQRPFQSFADWDYFVDTLSDSIFSPYTAALIPYPDVDRATVMADAYFQRIWKQAVKDVLKANFNPNGRPACYNTDAGARLLVDKANLFFPDDPAHMNDPKFCVPHHSTEWSFHSMGYFEITSLGQIKDPKGVVVAKRKVRSIICIGDAVEHTSQEDFERAPDTGKMDIVTRPEPMEYWKKADASFKGSNLIGDFMLKTTEGQQYDVGGIKLMEIPFTDNLDAKDGTWKGAETPPTTFKSSGMAYENENDLLPDGLYSSILRRSTVRLLRYRAAAPNEASFSSEANTGVNIGAYRGGIEFWMKSDFDSDAQVINGYLVTTHKIRRGPFTYKNESRSYIGGTQMFFFKNSDGSLRVCRLYYELFYDSSGKVVPDVPFADNPALNPPEAYKYWPPYPDDRGMISPPPGRPLPSDDPKCNTLNPHCKSARVDAIIPHSAWGGFKAGEWHHFVITWNDESLESNMLNANAGIRVAIDGKWVSGIVHRMPPSGSTVYTPYLLVNCVNPVDSMYLAGIYRWQRYRQYGVFKFEKDSSELKLPPNATIDNIFVSGSHSAQVQANPSRFFPAGYYENTITIPYPPGVDKITIRGISYCSYAPYLYRDRDGQDKELETVDPAGGKRRARDILSFGRTPGVVVEVTTESGEAVAPGKEIPRPATGVLTLKYKVNIFALNPWGSASNVATPVFDSISIHYLYPKETVLVYEQIMTE